MKVTFTCEKCGHERESELSITTTAEGDIADVRGTVAACPNCVKLSYGPLTEEMVAEALEKAAEVDTANAPLARFAVWEPNYERQARFVLRLLNELRDSFYIEKMPDDHKRGLLSTFNWRDWLLNLAKKS